MKHIKVMLWFDVEDFITPEADDALHALIDMMDSLGIIGSFKMVAEKARVLKARGREDILRKLSGHEICYHTENHSVHPTQTEYLQGMGFADGAAEFERREKKGFLDVQEITGQFPTSYGQPGASWVPQVFPVLKKWGVPTYVDSHYLLSVAGGPFWYGGILNLTRLWSTMRLEYTENGYEEAVQNFDDICRQAGETQLVSIYYHPCEFSCTDFWDGVNFRKGNNPPREEWKPAPLRTVEEMHRRIDLLGQFLRYTLTKPEVEYITASQSCRYEKVNPLPITAEDVCRMASALTEGPDYYTDSARSLCAAEILSLYARQIQGLHLTPVFSYGPEADVPSVICEPVSVSALAEAVLTQYDRVFGYRQLPVLYQVGENRINPVDLFCALGDAVAGKLPPEEKITIVLGQGRLQPTRHVNTAYDWVGDWIIFPEGLDASGIVRTALLQTWTLKPAIYDK
ncbi:MAG: hypothetical protein E7631_00810 [Ruminococcaceae bacterium]|nr:hypothetical protein [Oscillospiraceae bacterium]